MAKNKVKPPYALPVVSLLLVVLGVVYSNFILVKIPAKTLSNNVIFSAIPFICYFVAVLLVYIFLISLFSQILYRRISPKIFNRINNLIIAGIIGGILMMVQSFAINLFTVSFVIVLVSLLLFIFWSHIIPAHVVEEVE